MADYHFISYSNADASEFALRLSDALVVGPPSLPVWLDQRNLKPGREWDDQIASAIRKCKSLLFVMSRDSVLSNSVCKQEWTRALRYRKPVVPLMLHNSVEPPFRLGNRQYIPFSENFDTGLARLRSHLEWLESTDGQVQNYKDLVADLNRDLRRERDDYHKKRLLDEIASIEAEILELDGDASVTVTTIQKSLGNEQTPVESPVESPVELRSHATAEDEPVANDVQPPADRPKRDTPPTSKPASTESGIIRKNTEEVLKHSDVYAFLSDDPPPDIWYRELRPVLHQASHFSVPTYYLDANLKVIDWNVAFDLIFSELTGEIRYKHVNWFIVRLSNSDEVFDHARRFTESVRQGALPLVDIEPLRYESKYGEARFEKVASQLNDSRGNICGWSVALMIREIKWNQFLFDLRSKIWQDKLWSVYSSSYDRVLLSYSGYHKLINDVTSYVPKSPSKVVDLGAGSGNVTNALVQQGHDVTAVEINLGMLEMIRGKGFDSSRVTIVKGSVEDLTCLADDSYDAATMMNVLYAVDDPLKCLREIHRILKPGATLSYSTTHSDITLKPLLDDIQNELTQKNLMDDLARDVQNMRDANEEIERTIACRHSVSQYVSWTELAGFELLEPPRDTYKDAVTIVHARKRS